MKMDVEAFDKLLSEPARREWEGKLLAQVQEMLRNYDEWSREYKEKWDQSITQDHTALEEPARSIFLSKSGRSYEEWKKYKGERHDLIAILWALVNDPRGWDLDVIEEIVASRRERQRQRYQQIHGIPQDQTGSAGARPGGNNPPIKTSGRRRGAPATTRPIVVTGILQSIKNGRYTVEQLKSGEVTLEALAEEFNCSRSPVSAALTEIFGNGEAAGS
jgi:hypothetical protein